MDNEKKETTTPTAEELAAKANADKAEADKKATLDAEILAKETKKANLDKAILEAEDELQKKRKAKSEPAKKENEEEEVTIDMNDPGAKAWDKRIKETVQPLAQDLEKEKSEIRTFALKEFLADKPALAADPEKVKELIDIYDRIKTASERNKEGVLIDLKRAFGAIYSEQLISAAQTRKFDDIKAKQMFSEPGVDHGATTHADEQERMPNLSAADLAQLAKWNMTPQQWWDMKKGKKE